MEREPNSQHELLPETRRLLRDVEQLTGVPVEVRADADVRRYGRALYAISAGIKERHLILYDPGFARFASHLVAHELGHVQHWHEALPAARTVPTLTISSRALAIDQLAPDAAQVARRGIPTEALPGLVSTWLSGTVAQLVNTPSDIRIERWLFADHVPLRDIQRSSLDDQVRALHEVLSPLVETYTPRPIWVASNALNYAFVKDISGFLGEPWMLLPYRHSAGESLGEDLIESARTIGGIDGLDKDHHTVDAWAERLGIAQWFEWRAVD